MGEATWYTITLTHEGEDRQLPNYSGATSHRFAPRESIKRSLRKKNYTHLPGIRYSSMSSMIGRNSNSLFVWLVRRLVCFGDHIMYWNLHWHLYVAWLQQEATSHLQGCSEAYTPVKRVSDEYWVLWNTLASSMRLKTLVQHQTMNRKAFVQLLFILMNHYSPNLS